MSGPGKITPRHIERLAVVYIRQSSLAQVRENTESTVRQYGLAAEAARLGWEASKILTIDTNLGLSGRRASGRAGFKELVSRVCLGEVGGDPGAGSLAPGPQLRGPPAAGRVLQLDGHPHHRR